MQENDARHAITPPCRSTLRAKNSMRGKTPAAPGKLRIVAGSLRGSRIDVLDLAGVRPTSDRVRETLFNWLAPVIEGARCLDLFAGTGALGIEAKSRGAADCVFVERDRVLSQQLSDTLARLKVDGARVYNADSMAWLNSAQQRFDIVFLDPPFTQDLWADAARKLEQNGWLAPAAWIYVETAVGASHTLPENWILSREGRAGAVNFALYRRAESDPLS
jgi:16S rRNA (guanine966-N2)-methyltransferase